MLRHLHVYVQFMVMHFPYVLTPSYTEGYNPRAVQILKGRTDTEHTV